ncbi:hypothetical protein JCM19376_20710 [Fusibacter bizertensis]
MIAHNILFIDIDFELRELIKDYFYQYDTSHILAFHFTSITLGDYRFDAKKQYDLIVIETPPELNFSKNILRLQERYLHRIKVVLIGDHSDYDTIRSVFKQGFYDYWLKPYDHVSISNAIKTLVTIAYTQLNPYDIRYKIQFALVSNIPISYQDMRVYYNHFIKLTDCASDAQSVFSNALIDIFDVLDFEPLNINLTMLTDLCSKWIMTQNDIIQALHHAVVRIGIIYKEIFLPSVTSSLVRNAITEVLAPSSHVKTVSYLASRLYINQNHLSVQFKKATGITLSNYIKRVKMYGAMLMLLDPKYCIEDILNLLGYKDEGYFIKCFKSHTGMLPSVYKLKAKNFQIKSDNFLSKYQ